MTKIKKSYLMRECEQGESFLQTINHLTILLDMKEDLEFVDLSFVKSVTNDVLNQLMKKTRRCIDETNTLKETLKKTFKDYNSKQVDSTKNYDTYFPILTDVLNKTSHFDMRLRNLFEETSTLKFAITDKNVLFVISDILKHITKVIAITWKGISSSAVSKALEISLKSELLPHKEFMINIDKYARKLVSMKGFREYKKINPTLLFAKNNVIKWISSVKPRVNTFYGNLAHFDLDINSVHEKVDFISEKKKQLDLAEKIPPSTALTAFIKKSKDKVNRMIMELKAKLLIMERITQLRNKESQKTENSLRDFRKIVSNDWQRFETGYADITRSNNRLKKEVERLQKDRKKLEEDLKIVQREYDNAIAKRDRLQKARLGTQIGTGILSFLTFFIPVVGPAVSLGIGVAGIATDIGLNVAISEFSIKIFEIEAKLNDNNMQFFSISETLSKRKINADELNKYLKELEKLQDLINDSRGNFRITSSYFSFTTSSLLNIIKSLEDTNLEVKSDRFTYITVEIGGLEKDFKLLVDTINKPISSKIKRSADTELYQKDAVIPEIINKYTLLDDSKEFIDEGEVINELLSKTMDSETNANEFIEIIKSELSQYDANDRKILSEDMSNLLHVSEL